MPRRSRDSINRPGPLCVKYGVRFGAYHIYLPALLKPAPRALATQLWAIKHESPEAKGVGDLLHLAASGRTSIPVDKDTPKALYRTAGYRICGERAVRVDISGTTCRPHPTGAVLARRRAGPQTRWCVRRARLFGDRRDDIAHRRVGR